MDNSLRDRVRLFSQIAQRREITCVASCPSYQILFLAPLAILAKYAVGATRAVPPEPDQSYYLVLFRIFLARYTLAPPAFTNSGRAMSKQLFFCLFSLHDRRDIASADRRFERRAEIHTRCQTRPNEVTRRPSCYGNLVGPRISKIAQSTERRQRTNVRRVRRAQFRRHCAETLFDDVRHRGRQAAGSYGTEPSSRLPGQQDVRRHNHYAFGRGHY